MRPDFVRSSLWSDGRASRSSVPPALRRPGESLSTRLVSPTSCGRVASSSMRRLREEMRLAGNSRSSTTASGSSRESPSGTVPSFVAAPTDSSRMFSKIPTESKNGASQWGFLRLPRSWSPTDENRQWAREIKRTRTHENFSGAERSAGLPEEPRPDFLIVLAASRRSAAQLPHEKGPAKLHGGDHAAADRRLPKCEFLLLLHRCR